MSDLAKEIVRRLFAEAWQVNSVHPPEKKYIPQLERLADEILDEYAAAHRKDQT